MNRSRAQGLEARISVEQSLIFALRQPTCIQRRSLVLGKTTPHPLAKRPRIWYPYPVLKLAWQLLQFCHGLAMQQINHGHDLRNPREERGQLVILLA
jgi:hypothetical protein